VDVFCAKLEDVGEIIQRQQEERSWKKVRNWGLATLWSQRLGFL
jgi:hypothetical protein